MGPLLLAGIPVTDLAAAIDWYGRLFGDDEPFIPNDTEAVWDLAEDRSVYVALHPGKAGHAMVGLYVDDLEARIELAASRGGHPTSSEAYDNGVRRVVFRDADGNEFAFGGLPVDDT
jgi:catechol 2,3-dioxygenase-like lactoylglutathione lyase family enzyme